MITRRRGCVLNNSAKEEEPVESEVCSADLSPSETFPSKDLDLDDLFDIDDFKWTLDRDPVSSPQLLDLELAELGGVYAITPRENDRREVSHRQSNGLNKNAIAARLNRIKKKEYISGLERKVNGLSSENGSLKAENARLTRRVEELESEARYLRAVLANESVLAQLLARLGGVSGMKLSSSLFQGGTGGDPSDHDYALPCKRAKVEEVDDETATGGVCLHVDRNHVSVEFCPQCAQRASTAFKM